MDTNQLVDATIQPKAGQEAESSYPQGLSKKAQKRAAKAARLHERKLERRTREKAAKKNKRRERVQAIANSDDNITSQKRWRRDRGGETEIFNARVVVDLGFDELMSDKEINSLTSQLAYTYGANRRAAHPLSELIFTSFNGRTKQKLDAINDAGYTRWTRTEWWEEGYDRLWTAPSQYLSLPSEETSALDSIALPAQADRQKIVYLTADSPEELLELNEGETYIIGGICDHNRYKSLCLNKAIDSQIRHAHLPIGRYISLATRKVLTVNQVCSQFIDTAAHILASLENIIEFWNVDVTSNSLFLVFEILLKWIDTRSWEDAFWAVIPTRKFQIRRQGQGKEGGDWNNGGHGSNVDDE